MSFRRVARAAAVVAAILLWAACGQIYRPVVIPCTGNSGLPSCPYEPPPTPSNFHAVYAIYANAPSGINASAPNYPGGAMQIDVTGDSIIAETPSNDNKFGNNPTNAAIVPNNSRVFVASAGSVFAGGLDLVSSFTTAPQLGNLSGFGPVNSIALPTGSQPVFVNTTQNSTVYVANYGTNSLSAISTTTNVVTNTVSVGTNPVAIAELPNALKLYVANQGNNTISTLNTANLAGNTVSGLVGGFTGLTPVWMAARSDSQKVYVISQADGQLWTIDALTDSIACGATCSLPVGVGVNFIYYDPNLNRLYVTNPATSMLYVFSDTGGVNDTPLQLAAISFAAGSAMCPSGCSPESVTALADGSRFYVASYRTAAACPDPVIGSASACVIPALSVFDAISLLPEVTPALTLLAWSPSGTLSGSFAPNQYAVLPSTACTVTTPYSPTTTRFRVFTTASADSSRVYVSMCDAGAIADINTTDNNANNPEGGLPSDTLVTDLPAAFGSGPIQKNGEPANQSPLFMLTGQ